MGKNARIQELEQQLVQSREINKLLQEGLDFLKILAKLPDDAILLYTSSGQRTQCEIGLAAKRFLERLEKR